MSTLNTYSNGLFSEIAKCTELCFEPWKFSVVKVPSSSSSIELDNDNSDLLLLVECRDKTGKRFPDKDLELEIFRSGADINITLSCRQDEDYPILWHGNHSVWMESLTGKLCNTPANGSSLEALARRLKTLFSNYKLD